MFEQIKKWLCGEYSQAGMRFNESLIMHAIEESIEDVSRKNAFDKRWNVTENISVLVYQNKTVEVHFGVNGYSTFEFFKEEEEMLELRYLVPGLIKASKPKGFEEMNAHEKEEWATNMLAEKSDFEIIEGTCTLVYNGSTLNKSSVVYDEAPLVAAIESEYGEKLLLTTPEWNEFAGFNKTARAYQRETIAYFATDIYVAQALVILSTKNELEINIIKHNDESSYFEVQLQEDAMPNNIEELLVETLRDVFICSDDNIQTAAKETAIALKQAKSDGFSYLTVEAE